MNSVRHSRQIVRYDANGGGWQLTASVDENSPPPHVAASARRRPPPVWPPPTIEDDGVFSLPPLHGLHTVPVLQRSVSPTLPPRRSRSSGVLLPVTNVTELVLKKEIGQLETELARATRLLKVQDKLVSGFCGLKMLEKQ